MSQIDQPGYIPPETQSHETRDREKDEKSIESYTEKVLVDEPERSFIERPMNKDCRVAVMIPVYNETADTLLRSLSSLAKQEGVDSNAFEVDVVINNRKQDAKQNTEAFQANQNILALIRHINGVQVEQQITFTAEQEELIRKIQEKGLVINAINKSSVDTANTENNVGIARNRAGAEIAQRFVSSAHNPEGIIAVTDSDCVFSENYIRSLIDSFHERNINGVSGNLAFEVDPALPHQDLIQKAFNLYMGISESKKDYGDSPNFQVQEGALQSGANMAVTARAWADVGGMPPLAGGEDIRFGQLVGKLDGGVAKNYGYTTTSLIRVSERTGLQGNGRIVKKIKDSVDAYVSGKSDKILIEDRGGVNKFFGGLIRASKEHQLTSGRLIELMKQNKFKATQETEEDFAPLVDAINQELQKPEAEQDLRKIERMALEKIYPLYPEKDVTEKMNETNGAETNKEKSPEQSDQDYEQQVTAETRQRALEESRTYFANQSAFIENKTTDNAFKNGIIELLGKVNRLEAITDEEVKRVIGEGATNGMVKAMKKILEECKPVADYATAYDGFANLLKEKFHVGAQMNEAMTYFDAESGWYHDTSEGKTRLGEIRSEIESRKEEFGSQEKILQAQNLIEQTGGAIETETKPYKKFDTAKHERFLIQKGNIEGQNVVFKIGEAKDERTVQNESRNLKAIELAPVKPDETLDVHFVRQIGDVYKNDEMVGLATEFIQDNPELKKQLSAQQKIEVMSNVIDNLQRLTVTDAARESGMPVHDGQKISRDSRYFLQQLVMEGRLDQATAEALQRQFQAAETSLIAEEPVFVHGDAHGDNIFVNKKDDGTLDTALLDFEGLRISNKYHDWSELINKSVFLKHIQKDKPELFEPIKRNVENMWLDASVEFDEQAIIDSVSGGDPEKARNFKLTRMYDMLNRIMSGKNSENPMAQERVNLYLEQLKKNVG